MFPGKHIRAFRLVFADIIFNRDNADRRARGAGHVRELPVQIWRAMSITRIARVPDPTRSEARPFGGGLASSEMSV